MSTKLATDVHVEGKICT